ncbi:MAG: hypothetical protein RBR74_08525 [Ignavibacteriaceae bacterium]|jgi:hypothetical protein|nr:hypothetical protein [Ignavibacteriaceae bacterium]
MERNKTITEKLSEVISKEKVHFGKSGGTLLDIYDKLLKIGIDTKSTYSLPLKDTIGKTFREQIQFKNH